jgi:hypothetical protein
MEVFMKKTLIYRIFAAMALLLLTFLAACGTSTGAASQPAAQSSTLAPTASSAQAACSTQVARWSPVGKKWKLTVTFKYGPRAGQSELSYMTFLPDGTLTATFPSPTQGQPDILPPARDGRWCATGPAMFAYMFKDPILQSGKMIAYVQPAISARMTSATTYTGDGVGVAYETATGMPLPGQYGVTQTTAVAVAA